MPGFDPMNIPNIKCSCGNFTFRPTTVLKKISKTLIAQPKDAIMRFDIFVCEACGEVLPDSLPDPRLFQTVIEEPKEQSKLILK